MHALENIKRLAMRTTWYLTCHALVRNRSPSASRWSHLNLRVCSRFVLFGRVSLLNRSIRTLRPILERSLPHRSYKQASIISYGSKSRGRTKHTKGTNSSREGAARLPCRSLPERMMTLLARPASWRARHCRNFGSKPEPRTRSNHEFI